MKEGIVALVVAHHENEPCLIESVSDQIEIGLLEDAMKQEHENPLKLLYQCRKQRREEEEDFECYVEELLSKPFLNPEIQKHAVEWLKSKNKIEAFEKDELEAANVIAEYAFKIFLEDQSKTEFYLAGRESKVRVKIFSLKLNEKAA